MHTIYCVLGRTASGKSILAKLVAKELNLTVVKSYSTRPMRKGEEIESDHIFINEEDVRKYQDDMVAYTKIGDYEYFCTGYQLLDSDIYVIDPVGLYELLLKTKDMDINIEQIYITVPKKTLIERAKQRKDSMQSFTERFDAEDEQFSDYEKSDMIHYRVLNNGTIEESVQKLVRIITNDRRAKNERCR